ncbi:MAG: 16S rRNA (adenine(1518)-N(6)/adenine(1519)-N(6))-dimethyltransferase RsmA [bacterium]
MRQKFGQHFLKSSEKLKLISEAIQIQAGDTVIEIGPGHGELTNFIIAELEGLKNTKLILIERDILLIPELRRKFSTALSIGRLEIIEGDALFELPKLAERENIKNLSYKLVGNIPYYITGSLFRVIEGLKNKPSLAVFTLQKEVAIRVTADSPKMNLLSASVKYFANSELLMILSKDLFSPPPEVDSAVIRLVTLPEPDVTPPEFYYTFIKALFKQPRKTLLNNLKELPEFGALSHDEQKKLLSGFGVLESSRPQDMHISAIKQLANVLYTK